MFVKLETVANDENFSIEVIVADNGSKDTSIEIAAKFNTRVVQVSRKGYGAALMGGIEEAKAPFVLMADADDSYDFLELPKFFQKAKEGFDLIQGCRLPGGGGELTKVRCHGLIATSETPFSPFWQEIGSAHPLMMFIVE